MSRSHMLAAAIALLPLLPLAGCASFSQATRDDVSARMASISEPVSACYQAALGRNRKLGGTMTVSFTAENKTGQFKDAKVTQSLGDAELDSCVLAQVQALKLTTPTKTNLAVSYPIEFAALD